MPASLLQLISLAFLPLTVSGADVLAVESLIDGGLVKATVFCDPEGHGVCRATVHEITPLGHRHLRAFPGDRSG